MQPPPPAQVRRRVSGRVIAVLIGLVLLLPLICWAFLFTFTFIPPIRVHVVDAVSGQPIAGIAVTQRVTFARADAPAQQYTVTKTTGSNGYVLFRHYLYRWPVFATEGYTISVNEKSMAASPWRKEVDLGPNQTNKYFPMNLTARCPGCELLWRAPNRAEENLRSLWFVTVPLIPALDSPDKCSSIANPTVSKQCTELNTYRSAFLHFDSLQDVENNKAICRQLEDQAAKTCLGELAGYVGANATANVPAPYKHRQMPMLPTLPPEQVLPFDTIAGLAISNRRTCCNNAFSGSVAYLGTYGWGDHQINVRIEDYLTEDAARQTFSALSSTSFDRNPKSTTVEEIRSGNRIIVHRNPHIKTAFGESGDERDYWRSASKVILIYIFLPRPAYEEAVTKYLGLYPSGLRPNDLAGR